MSDTSMATTGDGLLVGGVTSARTPEQIRAEQAAINGFTAPNSTAASFAPQTPPPGWFTEADIEKARQQEKEKLYPQLQQVDSMRAELDEIKREREEAQAAKEAAEQTAAEAQRLAEEEKLSVRELLQRKDEEWTQRFNQQEEQRRTTEALLEKERRFSVLQEYRNNRLREVADTVIPVMHDFVSGESEEEIEASIADVQRRTQEIMMGVQTAQQQAWVGMRGTAPTAPVGGPLENVPQDKPMTEQDIRDMSMADYARNRGRLHQAASAQFYGRGRG